MPHRKSHVLADVARAAPSTSSRRSTPRARRTPTGRGCPGTSAPRLPARGRAPLRPVALDAERRDDAQPVEDGAPGGDRRRLRDDRLLALQRRLPRPHLLRAAVLADRDLEPHGVPAARGLRLRGEPVQLHLHRRQPLVDARAHGQHGRLEAGVDRRALRVLPHAAPAGGGPPRRRDQPRLRLRGDDRDARAREPRPRRHPLHRLDRGLQRHVGDGRARTSARYRNYPRIVGETGGKDFILAHPSADAEAVATPSSAARSSTRARSARRRRACTSRRTSGPR